MGRMFWILMFLLGTALLLLILNHDSGTVLGLPNGAFASIVALCGWGALVLSGVIGTGTNFGKAVAQLLVWVVIFLALAAGYVVFQVWTREPAFDGPTEQALIIPLEAHPKIVYATRGVPGTQGPYSSAGRATDL